MEEVKKNASLVWSTQKSIAVSLPLEKVFSFLKQLEVNQMNALQYSLVLVVLSNKKVMMLFHKIIQLGLQKCIRTFASPSIILLNTCQPNPIHQPIFCTSAPHSFNFVRSILATVNPIMLVVPLFW